MAKRSSHFMQAQGRSALSGLWCALAACFAKRPGYAVVGLEKGANFRLFSGFLPGAVDTSLGGFLW
jgi:hypothetical protein